MPCGRRHADRFPCPLLTDARHCRLTLLAMGLTPVASDTESSQSAQSQLPGRQKLQYSRATASFSARWFARKPAECLDATTTSVVIARCKGGEDAGTWSSGERYLSMSWQGSGRSHSRTNCIVKVKNLLVGVSFARALARSLRNRVDREALKALCDENCFWR